MKEKLKIAGVQMEPKILEKDRNLTRCLELIQDTAREGARLIVFPECALTGYVFSGLEEALPLCEPIPGPSTEKILGVCRDKYRKVHLPYLGVDRFVNHGNLPPTVCETEIGRIGMGICYDINFPEHARVLALKGADIIVLPTNWPLRREFVPEHIIPARAAENLVFVVAVNRVGEERGSRFIGRSKVAHWAGGIALAEGKPYEEDILYAHIEPATAREKHLVFAPGEFEVDIFKDRRPELYGVITDLLADPTRIRG